MFTVCAPKTTTLKNNIFLKQHQMDFYADRCGWIPERRRSASRAANTASGTLHSADEFGETSRLAAAATDAITWTGSASRGGGA